MPHRTLYASCIAWCIWLLLGAWAPVHADFPKDDTEKKAVTLQDHVVFYVRRGDGARSTEERARRASQALTVAVEAKVAPEVRVIRVAEVATVLAGDTPIVELREEDARLSADSSLDVHAAGVAARVRAVIDDERRRVSVAGSVFSVSLVVFFGLITIFLVNRVSQLAIRVREFAVAHPDSVPALRIKSVDVVSAPAVRNILLVLLGLARVGALFGLAYAWLILSLSLFESTRSYTETLTGFVLSPVTALVGRIASGLPLFAVVLAAGAAFAVLLRVSDLFFQSISRGETKVDWLSAEMGAAASFVARAVIVLFALIAVGPVITGERDEALSRTGLVLLFAIALAAVPALASIIAGLTAVFSGSLKVGDRVVYGGEPGRVREVGLLSLSLEADDGSTVRVPHARSLWHVTRLVERRRR